MKKLLLVFLLLPLFSLAQLEAGINGGITPFSITNTGPGSITHKTGTIYDLTLCYKLGKFRLGLGYNSSTLSYGTPAYSGTYYYAKPMTDAYFFADREWQFFEVASLYLGINAGSVSITYPGTSAYSETNSSAISYGAHLGYSRKLFAGLYANAQVGFTIIKHTTHGLAAPNYAQNNIATYPLTLGLHYKFDFRKKKKPTAAATVK